MQMKPPDNGQYYTKEELIWTKSTPDPVQSAMESRILALEHDLAEERAKNDYIAFDGCGTDNDSFSLGLRRLPLLSRMARAALNWSQARAANEAGIPKISLARFEALSSSLTVDAASDLFLIYEAAGVVVASTTDVLRLEIGQDAADLASESIKLSRRSDYKGEVK
jgi:hypothetical protein